MTVTNVARILGGNVARSPFIATPETGTVAVEDVSVRLEPPAGYTVEGADEDGLLDLTADIVEDDDNTFHVDYVVPDDAPTGRWIFRWESNEPSPRISHEASFRSVQSSVPNP